MKKSFKWLIADKSGVYIILDMFYCVFLSLGYSSVTNISLLSVYHRVTRCTAKITMGNHRECQVKHGLIALKARLDDNIAKYALRLLHKPIGAWFAKAAYKGKRLLREKLRSTP